MNFIYNALNSRQTLLNMLIQEVTKGKEIHVMEVYVENNLLHVFQVDKIVTCIVKYDNNGGVNFYEKKNKVEEDVYEVIRRFIERNVQLNRQREVGTNLLS